MRSELKQAQEHKLYLLLIVLLLATYICAALVSTDRELWGFDQLRQTRWPAVLVTLLVVGVAFVDLRRSGPSEGTPHRSSQAVSNTRLLVYALVALGCMAVFWLFRSQFLNPDGRLLAVKIPRDVPLYGAHLKHDEILELYVHSRFWYYANQRLGWSVVKSYQVLSVLAGGVAVFLLLVLTRLLQPRHSVTLFLLMVSGGYMQLFFGDVENYALVSALIVLYLLAAFLFLSGQVHLAVPSAVLAAAMCFHVIAGWLLPSLFYLYLLEWKRRRYRAVAVGIALSMLIVAGTLAAFHFSGMLPIQGLLTSHLLGDGRGYGGMLAPLSAQYYWEIANLLFLLFPAVLLLIPLLAFRRMVCEPMGIFLGLAGGCMLVFLLVWRAGLGVYYDWNLFAPGMIPVALLCFYSLLRIGQLRYRKCIWLGVLGISTLHSYAWIISNHFFQP